MVRVKQEEEEETNRGSSSSSSSYSVIRKFSSIRILGLWILLMFLISKEIYNRMADDQRERRREVLVSMCDQRARMLQDQFNVSVNHVHALAILVSTFHYYNNRPSAIDQVCLFVVLYCSYFLNLFVVSC